MQTLETQHYLLITSKSRQEHRDALHGQAVAAFSISQQPVFSCAAQKRILDSFVSHLLIGNKLIRPKLPVHRLQQGIYMSSPTEPTISYGTRVCLQLGQFAGFALPSHLRSEEGRGDKNVHIATTIVRPQSPYSSAILAALISSIYFDTASACIERDANSMQQAEL